MYEILVAVDADEQRALKQVEAITNLSEVTENTHVSLLHVFSENPEGASASQIASVRAVKNALEDAGIEVAIRERSGDPAETILQFADELDVDLISVSGRKRTPAGKALLGSVSQKVLLDAERPVLHTAAE
ncbi:universal stress protein [Halovenus marina]|uniref:universal stress protein n=1 Tax=Halovenus marina TaxID=3396621 RepID=UPI003F5456CB